MMCALARVSLLQHSHGDVDLSFAVQTVEVAEYLSIARAAQHHDNVLVVEALSLLDVLPPHRSPLAPNHGP